jgi:hypothetical protein
MLFVVTAIDRDDGKAIRTATRDAHLAYAKQTGVVRLGGPFLDENGGMIGSLIFIEIADLDAAIRWAADDPYAKAGLFQSTDIRSWKMTVNNCGAQLP